MIMAAQQAEQTMTRAWPTPLSIYLGSTSECLRVSQSLFMCHDLNGNEIPLPGGGIPVESLKAMIATSQEVTADDLRKDPLKTTQYRRVLNKPAAMDITAAMLSLMVESADGDPAGAMPLDSTQQVRAVGLGPIGCSTAAVAATTVWIDLDLQHLRVTQRLHSGPELIGELRKIVRNGEKDFFTQDPSLGIAVLQGLMDRAEAYSGTSACGTCILAILMVLVKSLKLTIVQGDGGTWWPAVAEELYVVRINMLSTVWKRNS